MILISIKIKCFEISLILVVELNVKKTESIFIVFELIYPNEELLLLTTLKKVKCSSIYLVNKLDVNNIGSLHENVLKFVKPLKSYELKLTSSIKLSQYD